jgi:hypothetical protein
MMAGEQGRMKKSNRIRWLGAITLGVILLLTLLAAPNTKLPAGSTYNRTPDGYGAWYAFRQQQGMPVQRWQKPFDELVAAERPMLLSQAGFQARRLDIARIKPVKTVEMILQARQSVKKIQVAEAIADYLLALVQRSRQYPDLALGASPRCAVAWLQTSQADAWLSGRDYVTPDDVKAVAPPLLRHRLILNPESLLDGIEIDETDCYAIESGASTQVRSEDDRGKVKTCMTCWHDRQPHKCSSFKPNTASNTSPIYSNLA